METSSRVTAKRFRSDRDEERDKQRVFSFLSDCLDALTSNEIVDFLNESRAFEVARCHECENFSNDVTGGCEGGYLARMDLCDRCRNFCPICRVCYSIKLSSDRHEHSEADDEKSDKKSEVSAEKEEEEDDEDMWKADLHPDEEAGKEATVTQ